jgi:polysaccharide biosynthesis protein PslG
VRIGAQQGRWVRRTLCTATATALLGLAAAPTAGAVPAKFWGVVPQGVPTYEQLSRASRGGVDSVRIPILWNVIQPSPSGPLEWSGVDAVVENAAAAGIEVLPFITGAPEWAVPGAPVPGTHGGIAAAPVRLPASGCAGEAWSAFLRSAVERYGPNGAYWAANPQVPRRPIRTWQVWNEPNFKYFVTHPNPGQYGKLVRISSAAIKGADPGAKVVLGGLFSRPREAAWKVKPPQAFFAADFLAKMYRRTPGIKSKFDGVAIHPYSTKYTLLKSDIEEVQAVLTANHDLRKGIWITELGWSSEKPDPVHDAFAKGVAGQARELKKAFGLLRSHQAKWRLRGVYWFSLEDGPRAACNFCGGAGLFGQGFVPKPSWYAYVRFAGGSAS